MRMFLAFCISFLTAGCSLLQPPPDLSWDHDPEAIVIRVSGDDGLVPMAAVYNDLPHAVVWGDGRIVWQTYGDDSERLVWQGQLSEQEMADLLQTFVDKGFFRLKSGYAPKEQVYDSSSTNLQVILLNEYKNVSEYHDGAPRRFHELVGLVGSGAGAEGQPYVPKSGHLTASPLTIREGMDLTAVPRWDAAALGLDLADATGIWVEGEALARAWEIVNQKFWSPQVMQGDELYELYLQLPEITGWEPR
ncbi:MAG: hypothetical protein GY803_13895 [Chloroflexi bacterium]|nr:hypothetical protein [Chloroflexota bacterium]